MNKPPWTKQIFLPCSQIHWAHIIVTLALLKSIILSATTNNGLVQNWQRSVTRLYVVTLPQYIMWNTGLDESQAGIKTARRNIKNLRYADDTTLMPESEDLKNSWCGRKRRVKKLALNSTFKNLQSWHPVPSLHGKYMRKKWKQRQIFFSWAPKSLQTVTAAMKFKDACSLEEKL